MSEELKKYVQNLTVKNKKDEEEFERSEIEKKNKINDFKNDFKNKVSPVINLTMREEEKCLSPEFALRQIDTDSTHPSKLYELKYKNKITYFKISGNYDYQKVFVVEGEKAKLNTANNKEDLGDEFNIEEITKEFVEKLFFDIVKSISSDKSVLHQRLAQIK